jgi:group I intron endonuclease
MQDSIHSNITQCQFDWAILDLQPIPKLTEIGIEITPLPETQEYWWSELEYKRIPSKSGIYTIINMLNGHSYIGSAVDLCKRKSKHFRELHKKEHHSPYLQNAYNCYGADAFRFAIVEYVANKEDLIAREQNYIDILNPEYNIARIAGNTFGVKRSEETKAKMSQAQKGRTHTEETKKQISETKKGHEVSETTRTKIGETQKGRTLSEEHRQKVSEAMKGHEVSENTRAIISEALKGNTNSEGRTYSEETCRKISEALEGNTNAKGHKRSEETKTKISKSLKGRPAHNRGKPMSEAQKAKIGKANKGRIHTEESRRHMSEAHKGKKRGP